MAPADLGLLDVIVGSERGEEGQVMLSQRFQLGSAC